MAYGLGLKYPDRNPLELPAATLPTLDYRTLDYTYLDIMAPIEDQGQTGDCWVYSVCGIFEAYHFRRTGNPLVVSKPGVWYLAKTHFEANDFADDGGYPSDTIRTLEGVGYVDDVWEPSDQRTPVPVIDIRRDFMAKGIVSVPTSIDGVVLAGHAHGPVAICVNWPSAWYTASPVDANGVLVPLNGSTDSVGGHAICALAHRPAGALYPGSPSATLIRNSWSTAWGGGAHAQPGYAWARDEDLAAILIDGNVCMQVA